MIDDLCEVEETELPYMLSGKALINQYFYQKVVWLNQGLGEGGIYGCLQFVLHYLIQRKPYQIGCISQSGHQVIYEHFFQTFNHNLVENINYWLWALSGGVEKVNKIHSTALRSHYLSFSGYVFFWWGSHVTNRLVWKGVPKLFSAFYIKKWGVVLQKKTDENQIFQTHQNYQMAFPDAENGWADPFLVQHKDQHYLFLEELNEQKQKGTIVVAQLDVNGGFQRIESILSESYHLSYPFVFEKEGQWFMIPESAQGKCIRLYKADHFPYKWQWIKNLRVDVQAYDTTPFYYNANWWIFTVIKKGEGASSFDQLFLFYAKDLIEDQWKSHPQNPVVTDSRSARPAGKIFFRNGKMYRPSQNCLERYGHKLIMNEILQLSATHYEEQVSEEITLHSRTDVTGIHTYNANETLLVVDALFRKWSLKKESVCYLYDEGKISGLMVQGLGFARFLFIDVCVDLSCNLK